MKLESKRSGVKEFVHAQWPRMCMHGGPPRITKSSSTHQGPSSIVRSQLKSVPGINPRSSFDTDETRVQPIRSQGVRSCTVAKDIDMHGGISCITKSSSESVPGLNSSFASDTDDETRVQPVRSEAVRSCTMFRVLHHGVISALNTSRSYTLTLP